MAHTAASAAPAVRNIVLVHGAFADGSSWSPVIVRLQRMGYQVTAVQNPLTSLADDVAATERVVHRQTGGVLLVGHSWAGAVITQAGNAANVKGLVYLSALVPDDGESVADLLQRLDAPMTGLAPDSQGLIWLDDARQFQHVMAADIPLEQARALASVQQPALPGRSNMRPGTTNLAGICEQRTTTHLGPPCSKPLRSTSGQPSCPFAPATCRCGLTRTKSQD